MRMTILGLVAVLLPAAGSPDEVYLTSGGQLSGRIVSRTASMIEVDVGAGKIGVPTSSVVRIEEGRSALQEYEERAGQVPGGDVAGWLALGEWASAKGLGTQAREAYHRALAASPGDPRANAALGNVQMDGRWVSEDESYRARGYVPYEGEWITPAEHEAILRERAAAEEDKQAEARAQEAEARAQEAEARAKEAEAAAAATPSWDVGLPMWYGWGGGPVVWPTGPIVNRPVAPSRAVPPSRPAARPAPVRK